MGKVVLKWGIPFMTGRLCYKLTQPLVLSNMKRACKTFAPKRKIKIMRVPCYPFENKQF